MQATPMMVLRQNAQPNTFTAIAKRMMFIAA
jgi:hypothetical protein